MKALLHLLAVKFLQKKKGVKETARVGKNKKKCRGRHLAAKREGTGVRESSK